jgi:mevalonate kinase
MTTFKNGVLALTPLLALTLLVSAQQSPTSNQQPQGQSSMQAMNNDMMQNCQTNMQSLTQTNDRAMKDIETAKQSNDPAKMRGALDEAEKALKAMNDHMNTCMSMMNKMKSMRGMMGGEQSKPNPQQ